MTDTPEPSGRLLLATTPLGDPGDASARLLAALDSADVIAAEDTRRLRNLASALGVTLTGRVVSHYDAVEVLAPPRDAGAGRDSGLLGVLVVLTEVRHLLEPIESRPWPPVFFGAGRGSRRDVAARLDDTLDEGFGLSA